MSDIQQVTAVDASHARTIVCPRCGSDLFNIPRTDAFCTATRQIEPSFVDDMSIFCAECGHEMEDERPAISDAYYEVARLADTAFTWRKIADAGFPTEKGLYAVECHYGRFEILLWSGCAVSDRAHWQSRSAMEWLLLPPGEDGS